MKNIIVTGNSGKTTFSYFLAEKLSKTHKVILISTDTEKGMIKCLFPDAQSTENRSLGNLLADPIIIEKDVYDNSYLVDDNFLFISYTGDIELHPNITSINCSKLFSRVSQMADYLIVDTSKHIFDKFMLSSPNKTVISVTTCDLRGYHYRIKNPISDINVLLQATAYSHSQDVLSTFEKRPFEITYSKQLQSVYTGESIKNIPISKSYTKTLNKIIELISAGDEVEL
ncbi:MAG: hypothetical protein R3Y35_13015 [Clostridia bacterium]